MSIAHRQGPSGARAAHARGAAGQQAVARLARRGTEIRVGARPRACALARRGRIASEERPAPVRCLPVRRRPSARPPATDRGGAHLPLRRGRRPWSTSAAAENERTRATLPRDVDDLYRTPELGRRSGERGRRFRAPASPRAAAPSARPDVAARSADRVVLGGDGAVAAPRASGSTLGIEVPRAAARFPMRSIREVGRRRQSRVVSAYRDARRVAGEPAGGRRCAVDSAIAFDPRHAARTPEAVAASRNGPNVAGSCATRDNGWHATAAPQNVAVRQQPFALRDWCATVGCCWTRRRAYARSGVASASSRTRCAEDRPRALLTTMVVGGDRTPRERPSCGRQGVQGRAIIQKLDYSRRARP